MLTAPRTTSKGTAKVEGLDDYQGSAWSIEFRVKIEKKVGNEYVFVSENVETYPVDATEITHVYKDNTNIPAPPADGQTYKVEARALLKNTNPLTTSKQLGPKGGLVLLNP